MRVMVVNKFYYVLGGVERYLFQWNHVLEQHGHAVIPFSTKNHRNEPNDYEEYFLPNVEYFKGENGPGVLSTLGRTLYSLDARRRIERLIDATTPDIAHLHGIYHHMSPSILHSLANRGLPVVQTLHDYKLICPTYSMWVDGEPCERCKGGHFYETVVHRCNRGSLLASSLNAFEMYFHSLLGIYSLVTRFISPSRFLRQRMIDHGIPADKIDFIPNFLNFDDYEPTYDHNGYLLFAGRLTAFKGVDTLIEAMARLKPEMPLYIAGDGPERSSLEQLVREKRLSGVFFLGHQREQDLKQLLAGAAVVVVPSRWYENCPYAVLEAFAMGKPVLGAAIGGIPELIDPGETGELFQAGSAESLAAALDGMLTRADCLPGMGKSARNKIEREYGPDLHYERVVSVYQRAAEELAL